MYSTKEEAERVRTDKNIIFHQRQPYSFLLTRTSFISTWLLHRELRPRACLLKIAAELLPRFHIWHHFLQQNPSFHRGGMRAEHLMPLSAQRGRDKPFRLCLYRTLNRDVAPAPRFYAHSELQSVSRSVFNGIKQLCWWHWEIIAVFISALRWIVWQKNPFKLYLVSTHTLFPFIISCFFIFTSIWGR